MEMTYSKWSGNVEVWGLEGLEGGNILMNVLCETVESTVWLCPWEGIYSAHGQSCRTLWDPMDCSPPGSSVHRILQQEYWSGLPCPPPRDLPDPGIKPASLMSPALAGGFFTPSAIWEVPRPTRHYLNKGKRTVLVQGYWHLWDWQWLSSTGWNLL